MNDTAFNQGALFAGAESEIIHAFLKSMTPVHLARGEVLFHEGDQDISFYIIVSGKIKIRRTLPDGRKRLLALLGSGDMVGDLALLDTTPSNTTAVAVGETKLISLSREELIRRIDEQPEIAKYLLTSLALCLRQADEAKTDLVFSDVSGRVAKILLSLGNRFGEMTESGIRVPHDLTQEEIAQLVGASRETVNKALVDFVSRGWIQLENRTVIILDSEHLGRRSH